MPEAVLRPCRNCSYVDNRVTSESGTTVTFDEEGTLTYVQLNERGVGMGRMTATGIERTDPDFVASIENCIGPSIRVETRRASGLRGWLGLSETVEVKECGAVSLEDIEQLIAKDRMLIN